MPSTVTTGSLALAGAGIVGASALLTTCFMTGVGRLRRSGTPGGGIALGSSLGGRQKSASYETVPAGRQSKRVAVADTVTQQDVGSSTSTCSTSSSSTRLPVSVTSTPRGMLVDDIDAVDL